MFWILRFFFCKDHSKPLPYILSSLLSLIVPWTSMELFKSAKGSLQWKKVLCIIKMFFRPRKKKKGSSKNKGSLRNPKWFFNGMTTKNLLKINEQEFKGILTCIYPFNIYFQIYHCTTQDFSSMKHLQTHCSTEKQPDKSDDHWLMSLKALKLEYWSDGLKSNRRGRSVRAGLVWVWVWRWTSEFGSEHLLISSEWNLISTLISSGGVKPHTFTWIRIISCSFSHPDLNH